MQKPREENKGQKWATRLLDQEGIYNHLYYIAAKECHDVYIAEDKLRDVWALISSICDAASDKTVTQSYARDQLVDAADRYFRQPHLQSKAIRDLLVYHIYRLSLPVDEDPISLRTFMLVIIALAVVYFLSPNVAQMISYALLAIVAAYFLRKLYFAKRTRLAEAALSDLRSAVFDEGTTIQRFQELSTKGILIPTVAIKLLNNSPPAFTEEELAQFKQSISIEQWKRGMEIKSGWQHRLRNDLKT